ncbi:MAG TPA: glucose 1-dehydrogenase [Pseudonocardia sp.]|nr:glucose 1-dehydrogenase [Pseudonocardia sp.]
MTVLHGKVAVVTGASRGIGRAIALALAEAGADVAVAGRDTARLDAVAAEIRGLGRRALPVRADVTDRDQVEELVARTVGELGGLDVVVNNSGVVSSVPLLEVTDEEWDRVVDTNLRGVFLVTRAAGRHLVEQGSGKVLNIASNFAFKGVAGHAAYCASKAAVVAFTRTMAVEWARHGVQVNALAPGYVATDLNAGVRADAEAEARIVRSVPARRMGRADELGPWAVLLASSASDYTTGETVTIDGGLTAR